MLPRPLLLLLSALLPAAVVRAAPTDVPSAASFYVPTLPDLHQDTEHPLRIWAGHLSSDPNETAAAAIDVTAHLYFVLTKARRSADKERVIFWFNGGPGCSSFDGLMMEIGPWRVDGKGGLQTHEGGWEEYAHVVYVDQPAGTGYSYASTNHYVHELSEATDQFMVFLSNFYAVFPELKSMDTYISGESYAGQYIPYFAHAMLNSTLNIPFRGAAIGNGWIDGRHQYPGFLQYAVKHGLVEEHSEDYTRGKAATDKCMTELAKINTTPEPVNVDICEAVLPSVLHGRTRKENGTEYCTNIYDVRLEDTVPACGMNWPPDLAGVTPYLDRPDVQRALHAGAAPTAWTECRGRVHAELQNKHSASAITLLPSVLERAQVLLFAGDQDFICNYVGVENVIRALEWNGGTGLGTVATKDWSVNGTAAGTWVSARNLTYAKIFNASHMVGFDVPHVAHDMMLRFMGVDFSALAGGSARIPSAVGDAHKPSVVLADAAADAAETQLPPAKTPAQDKAMWEAYYNAGSAAIVLVLVLLAIGVFVWCRIRRRRRARGGAMQLPPRPGPDDEESIPLRATNDYARSNGRDHESGGENRYAAEDEGVPRYDTRAGSMREGKGKARAQEAIFDVGESDEEK